MGWGLGGAGNGGERYVAGPPYCVLELIILACAIFLVFRVRIYRSRTRMVIIPPHSLKGDMDGKANNHDEKVSNVCVSNVCVFSIKW